MAQNVGERMPARYVVHRERGIWWVVHEKDSPYCAKTNPGWAGRDDCGCLGLSSAVNGPGRFEYLVAEAHRRATAERTRFLRRMQARGKDFPR